MPGGVVGRAKAAAASGKQGGAKAGDATRRALQETINKDDIRMGGGWEQFDLNKMNYEQETRGASAERQHARVSSVSEASLRARMHVCRAITRSCTCTQACV